MPALPQTLPIAALLLLLAAGPTASAQDPDSLPGGTMVRGTVTAVGANALTLHSEDGDTVQVTVTPNTRVVHERQPARMTDIHVGDGVGAGGILDAPNHTLHAAFVGFIDAEEVRKAQADLGKTYIIGKVTAIDMDRLRLTIHRPDNTSQSIAVDESTAFRRGGRSSGPDSPAGGGAGASRSQRDAGQSARPAGDSIDSGEPITLADIKVGESVAGRGAVKNGLFLPSELHVYVPRARSASSSATTAPSGARP